jgi:CBS domain-containing protein
MKMSSTVRHILLVKGTDVWSIAPDSTVFEALQVMADKDVGALLVLEHGEVIGIFSERDYARRVILEGKSSKTAPVRDLMARQVLSVGADEPIENCMKLMTDKHVRHLPVMENEQLIGIVSIGDVVNKMISEQDFTIHQLEKFITGARQ